MSGFCVFTKKIVDTSHRVNTYHQKIFTNQNRRLRVMLQMSPFFSCYQQFPSEYNLGRLSCKTGLLSGSSVTGDTLSLQPLLYYLSACLPTFLCICRLYINQSICLSSIYISNHLSIYLSIIYISTYLCNYLSLYSSFPPSSVCICVCFCMCVCVSLCVFI